MDGTLGNFTLSLLPCVAHLIQDKLCTQVHIGACSVQVAVDQGLHALLFQGICHVVEGILIGKCCQCLGSEHL